MTFLNLPMAIKRSHKKIKKSQLAHKKAKKKSTKKSSSAKKSHKKTTSAPKKRKPAVKRVPKPQVTFIPEPWSKVAKYKKIKKDGYGGYW